MKSFRSTIILFTILIILILGYLLGNNIWASEDKTIYKLEAQSIAEIEIQTASSKCTFIKNGESWEMTIPKKYRINQELVVMMARRLENFDAIRVLGKKPGNLTQYGLDRPSMTIRFKSFEGNESKLLVGYSTSSNYQYYVMDSESKAVCTVTNNDLDAFKGGNPSEFRDRSILTQGLGSIKCFGIKSGEDKKVELVEYEAGKWLLVEPCKAEVKNNNVNEILSKVATLEIKEFVKDDPEDFNKYGLENPIYTLFVEDENENKRNFYFGMTEDDKKEVYIRTDNEKGVFKISTEDFDPGLVIIDDLINIAPLSIGIGHVSKITVNDAGIISVFERDFSNINDDIFTLNGHPILSEDFMALYVNIMALSAEGYDGMGKRGSVELSITFEFINSSESIKLDLSGRDDKSYFLAVNDALLPFYIKNQKVDLVRKWMSRIMKAD